MIFSLCFEKVQEENNRGGKNIRKRVSNNVNTEARTQKKGSRKKINKSQVIGWGHRVSDAGLPIEQVLREYSLSLP